MAHMPFFRVRSFWPPGYACDSTVSCSVFHKEEDPTEMGNEKTPLLTQKWCS